MYDRQFQSVCSVVDGDGAEQVIMAATHLTYFAGKSFDQHINAQRPIIVTMREEVWWHQMPDAGCELM